MDVIGLLRFWVTKDSINERRLSQTNLSLYRTSLETHISRKSQRKMRICEEEGSLFLCIRDKTARIINL